MNKIDQVFLSKDFTWRCKKEAKCDEDSCASVGR